MRLLLILGVALLAVWLWRSGRPSQRPPNSTPRKGPAEPQEMVSCAYCALHLPKAEALEGRRGWYCSTDHRHRTEP